MIGLALLKVMFFLPPLNHHLGNSFSFFPNRFSLTKQTLQWYAHTKQTLQWYAHTTRSVPSQVISQEIPAEPEEPHIPIQLDNRYTSWEYTEILVTCIRWEVTNQTLVFSYLLYYRGYDTYSYMGIGLESAVIRAHTVIFHHSDWWQVCESFDAAAQAVWTVAHEPGRE